MPQIILASASPRRADLLREMGLNFIVVPSDLPEILPEQLTAREVSQINAYRKARQIAKKFPDCLVLAADTLVLLGTKIFGKPTDLVNAYQMLEALQGATHQVITAICLMHLRERRHRVCTEQTAVTFRKLDAVKIRRYLNKVDPLDKAGAYGIQEDGEALIEKISGSYSNVVGLPVERLTIELQNWPNVPPSAGMAALLAQSGTAYQAPRLRAE